MGVRGWGLGDGKGGAELSSEMMEGNGGVVMGWER